MPNRHSKPSSIKRRGQRSRNVQSLLPDQTGFWSARTLLKSAGS
jgi:hypothetical protein